MLRIFRHYIPRTLVLMGCAETLILFVSIFIGTMLNSAPLAGPVIDIAHTGAIPLWIQALVFVAAIALGMTAMGLYQRDQESAPRSIILRLLLSFGIGFLMMGSAYLVSADLIVEVSIVFTALLCSFIGIATCRLICLPSVAKESGNRVLVVGTGERARQIEQLARTAPRSGLIIVGFVDLGIDQASVNPERIITNVTNLAELTDRLAVNEVVVAIDDRRKGLPVNEFLECKMNGVRFVETAEFFERELGKIRLDSLHPSNLIFADGFTQAVIRLAEKRAVDLFASVVLLLLTAPVMIITAIAILVDDGGPILYRQERVGRKGQCFTLFKFRSMRQDAEKNGAVWARKDDDRVTSIGKFIRRTRIDELPQLFNVLRGDMSFVGPRPERPQFVAELSEAIPYYDLRHYVKPGITGWAQVLYPYGASVNDAREKLQYDLYYLKNYSLFLDLAIMMQTAQVILWGKGAR